MANQLFNQWTGYTTTDLESLKELVDINTKLWERFFRQQLDVLNTSFEAAVRDGDGYYSLRGRRSDVIISGGFNIYPREIEELLLEQPGVREAAVVGVPDEVRGEVPVAYVVADGELDAAGLETMCRHQLASFKVPRAFVRVDALPRTALGKVQKHLLPPWRAV